MKNIDMPIGATCHNERDDNGQWWIVWSTDFPGDKSGRKTHPESISLEEAFKAGYEKRESEFVYNPDYLKFQDGVKEGRKLGIKDVVSWINDRTDKEVLSKYGTVALGFSVTTWNAKLKEWGLSEERIDWKRK